MKRTKKTIILLVMLAVLAGGYYGIQQWNTIKGNQVSEESGSFALTSQSADSLVGLHWESGDTVFDLSLNVGTWQTTGNPSYTVKQTAVQNQPRPAGQVCRRMI